MLHVTRPHVLPRPQLTFLSLIIARKRLSLFFHPFIHSFIHPSFSHSLHTYIHSLIILYYHPLCDIRIFFALDTLFNNQTKQSKQASFELISFIPPPPISLSLLPLSQRQPPNNISHIQHYPSNNQPRQYIAAKKHYTQDKASQ